MKTHAVKVHDVIVAGYIGVDLAPNLENIRVTGSFSDILKPGKIIEIGDLTISLGGVVANTGLALKRFGKKVMLMGLVGHDRLGENVIAILREEGLSAGIMRSDKAGTAYCIMIAPPGIDRMYLESPGCNTAFSSSDIDYNEVSKSQIFHFGYPPLMKRFFEDGGTELAHMFYRAHECEAVTSLDMTLPDTSGDSGKVDWRKILAAAMPNVDIFVPSIEEILVMLEPTTYTRIVAECVDGDIIGAVPDELFDSLGDRLLNMGTRIVLIKAGPRGAYLRTGDVGTLNEGSGLSLSPDLWNNRDIMLPAYPVDPERIINASGAGDVAVAGFLAAIIENETPERAGAYAMLAGRNNLYGCDALEGLTDWCTMTDELERV